MRKIANKKKLTLAARLAALESKVAEDCPEKPKRPPGRAVLVTTAHRGVFFGYATKTDGPTITLERSRLVVYWSADVRGFMGLAATGPSATCRIGPAADVTLRDITCVVEVTPEAVVAFERAPWKP